MVRVAVMVMVSANAEIRAWARIAEENADSGSLCGMMSVQPLDGINLKILIRVTYCLVRLRCPVTD